MVNTVRAVTSGAGALACDRLVLLPSERAVRVEPAPLPCDLRELRLVTLPDTDGAAAAATNELCTDDREVTLPPSPRPFFPPPRTAAKATLRSMPRTSPLLRFCDAARSWDDTRARALRVVRRVPCRLWGHAGQATRRAVKGHTQQA